MLLHQEHLQLDLHLATASRATTVINQLECLESEVTKFHTHQRGCNHALDQMMQALELHVGIDLDTSPTLLVNPYNTAQQTVEPSAGRDIEEEIKED